MPATRLCAEPGCPNRIRDGRTPRRCAIHQRPHQQRADARRPQRRTHQAITSNAALVAEHRLNHGDWCLGLPVGPAAHAAHPCADLVADHIDPVAWTHDEFGPRRVLCRSANSKLGATVRRSP